ncbi:hypothetical protein [Actinospica robiniae]|uniref:hypothetical protein n=1 Tax=Actinospica robiniae TaxID=304901 RepID=UPI000400F974|nr:hypothetical protein [Actinospica robiniae]
MSETHQQLGHTMALESVRHAITDVEDVSSRRRTIAQGLVGALLNALEHGATESEIAAVFEAQDLTCVRAALAEAPPENPEHVALLMRMLPEQPIDTDIRGARTGKTRGIADGLLSAAELAGVLRAAARVAKGDSNHDFRTVIDLLNTEIREPAGQRLLYSPEVNQVAHALCRVMDERDRYPVRPIAAVHKWTAEKRVSSASHDVARTALVELFNAAATLVEAHPEAADPDRDEVGR